MADQKTNVNKKKYIATCPFCGTKREITSNAPNRQCLSCALKEIHKAQRAIVIPKGKPFIGEIRYGREILSKDAKHRFIWAKCEDCGKERWVSHRGTHNRTICRHCAIKRRHRRDSPAWNEGRLLPNGYKILKLESDDFYFSMTDQKGYVSEHRLVMAKYLNRCLLAWEVVHHKNGNKQDNRIENLELLPTKRFHVVDTQAKSLIKRQQRKIKYLEGIILSFEKKPELRVAHRQEG